jgi:hypothetical protein
MAGVGAALAAAYLVPLLAVAIVWPLLYLVPGLALVAWIRPPIGDTGRLGLAIVISAALSTQVVYLLSLLIGYQRSTIFVASAVLALPAIALVRDVPGRDALRRVRQATWRRWHRSHGGLALALAAALLVGGVLGANLWRLTPEGVVSGGWNWSDLGVHLSIAESLNAGNFPPQIPYYAGEPLVYHWFADFHAAIAAAAVERFAVPAMVVQSAAMAGALVLVVHGLARHLLRHRRAATLAAALAVLGGGLGYVRLGIDLAAGAGDPLTLISSTSYDNAWLTDWPYFHIPSVMGTGLLAHRATLIGLPLLVAATLCLVAGLPRRGARAAQPDRPALIGLAGLLGAMLAPFHFFFFPAFLLLALAWVVLGDRLGRDAPRNALIFALPYVLAVPFAVAAFGASERSGWLQWVVGWEMAPMDDGLLSVGFFYLTNLGLPFALALVALVLPRTPQRLFLGGWVVALFVIPNVLQVSAVAFDMNKLFQAMWIAVALLAAWLIRGWPAPALALVFLISVPSPMLVSAWTLLSDEQVISRHELEAAAWMAEHTPEQSVFVTDGWLNSPTDAAGRLRLTTYGAYVANLGHDPAEREQAIHTIYCGGDPASAAALMRDLRADYVVDAGRPLDCPQPTPFEGAPGFDPVFTNEAMRIYRLTDAAGLSWPP